MVKGSSVVVPAGVEYEVLPKDVYQVELLDVTQKTQTKYQSQEEEEVLVFDFVIIDPGQAYGRHLWQYCSQKLSKYNGGSNLYKVLVGLNGGKEMTAEEFDHPEVVCSDESINALIGGQVRLSVGQKEKQDKTLKNVIESFLPTKTKLPAFDKRKVEATVEENPFDISEVSFDK